MFFKINYLSSFAPLVCVFLVTASCKFVLNYVLKIVYHICLLYDFFT